MNQKTNSYVIFGNGLVFNDSSGHYVYSPENIKVMFGEIKPDRAEAMLEPHQMEFIKSLKTQFEQRGSLTEKQFKWLEIYYNICLGDWDWLPDPATE